MEFCESILLVTFALAFIFDSLSEAELAWFSHLDLLHLHRAAVSIGQLGLLTDSHRLLNSIVVLKVRLQVWLRAIWTLISCSCLIASDKLAALILVVLDHRDKLSLINFLLLLFVSSTYLSRLDQLLIEAVDESLHFITVIDLLHDFLGVSHFTKQHAMAIFLLPSLSNDARRVLSDRHCGSRAL